MIFTACSQEPGITGRVEQAKDKKTSCFYPFICVDPKYSQSQNKVSVSSTLPVRTVIFKELLTHPVS